MVPRQLIHVRHLIRNVVGLTRRPLVRITEEPVFEYRIFTKDKRNHAILKYLKRKRHLLTVCQPHRGINLTHSGFSLPGGEGDPTTILVAGFDIQLVLHRPVTVCYVAIDTGVQQRVLGLSLQLNTQQIRSIRVECIDEVERHLWYQARELPSLEPMEETC